MDQGAFIVLEGVDGAGTTTHAKVLTDGLAKLNMAVHGTAQPSKGPIGAMLRQVLTGRVVVPSDNGPHAPQWSTMALLFAADRMDHLEAEIEPQLRAGVTVVCDRYHHSSVAYQSTTSHAGADVIQWIKETNRFARRPDLTIVLNVPPAVARERRRARGGKEIFDDDGLQSALCGFYATLERHFPDERIVHVSSDASMQAVSEQILKLALEVVSNLKPSAGV
jgi:dTMP kinase